MKSIQLMSRLLPIIDLPYPVGQSDRERYAGLSEKGAVNYEGINYKKPSKEDIYILAEEIAVNKYADAAFDSDDESRRYIETSTGPNLCAAIGALPFCDEFVAIEFSPGNIRRLHSLLGTDVKTGEPLKPTTAVQKYVKRAHTAQKLPEHWNNWAQIAAVLYEIGGAVTLDALKENNPDRYQYLMESLQKWQDLSKSERQAVYDTFIGDKDKQSENPYLAIKDLQKTLREKMKIVRGDLLDKIEGDSPEEIIIEQANDPDYIPLADLRPYVGTACRVLKRFASESISNDPRVVAHYETNWIQLARPDGYVSSAHMGGTAGYGTFITEDEQKKSYTGKRAALLEELYATAGYFRTTLAPIMQSLGEEQFRQGVIIPVSEEEKVRSDYSSMIFLSGRADHLDADGKLKFPDGTSLLRHIDDLHCERHFELPILRASYNSAERPVFCTGEELAQVDREEYWRRNNEGELVAWGISTNGPLMYYEHEYEKPAYRDEARRINHEWSHQMAKVVDAAYDDAHEHYETNMENLGPIFEHADNFKRRGYAEFMERALKAHDVKITLLSDDGETVKRSERLRQMTQRDLPNPREMAMAR